MRRIYRISIDYAESKEYAESTGYVQNLLNAQNPRNTDRIRRIFKFHRIPTEYADCTECVSECVSECAERTYKIRTEYLRLFTYYFSFLKKELLLTYRTTWRATPLDGPILYTNAVILLLYRAIYQRSIGLIMKLKILPIRAYQIISLYIKNPLNGTLFIF